MDRKSAREEGVSPEHKEILVSELERHGFSVQPGGLDVARIYVAEPLPDHPSFGLDNPLPVGFIRTDGPVNFMFGFCNLDKPFPMDYHSQLSEIYNSV